MNLPDVIVDEILLLLPLKSLGRFKLVCKDWYNQIQSKSFVGRHLENQRGKEEKLLIYHDRNRNYAVSICDEEGKQDEDEDGDMGISFHQIKQYRPLEHLKKYNVLNSVDIVGTWNGIVCVDHTEAFTCDPTYDKFIILWNPTTRELKTLPPFQLQRPPCTHIYGDHAGFGFDCNTDDYKVIRILYFGKEGTYGEQEEYIIQMKIYSLSKNSWREFDCSGLSAKIINVGTHYGMLFGNKFCWLARNFGDIERNELFILSFDMGKEVFQKTPLPTEYAQLVDRGWSARLLHMHESIALVLYVQTFTGVSFEICTKDLEQGRSSWIQLFSADQISGFMGMMPLGFWKCRNSEDLFLLFTGKNGMKGINMHGRGQIKSNGPMTINVKNNGAALPLKVLTYLETLVSIRS